ncbi:MAG: hypothetical protein AB7L90_11610 [Hyphomicrobiaceae bacterium]
MKVIYLRSAAVGIAVVVALGASWRALHQWEAVRLLSTREYIQSFSPKAYEVAGTDFFNERYSPRRLNKPLNQIDITFDFDFAYLKEISEKLAKVDRRAALKAIFEKVTINAATDTERHLAVLKFLQKVAYHSEWMQPMYEDRQAVFDPLVLLEIGTMRCGAVARVGADLFEAGGYKTRLVQAIAHVASEIFYDDSWHLFEADLAGGGQAPMFNGKILSVRELSEDPAAMDRLPSRLEAHVASHRIPHVASQRTPVDADVASERKDNGGYLYPSYFYFSKKGYASVVPALYYKTATPEQASASLFYGWNYYETVLDVGRKLSDEPAKYEPRRPTLKAAEIIGDKVRVTWEEADDGDNDLVGYRIYISSKSRGWNYQYFSGGASAEKYWDGGWKPEMYDALFREPPSELGLVTTKDTSVEVEVPPGVKRYVTIMPFDQYGESIGRRLYNMSEELTLTR